MPPWVYGTSPTVQIGTVLSVSLSPLSLARALSLSLISGLYGQTEQEDETKRGTHQTLGYKLNQYVYHYY
jgi:hypothetical protein